MIGIDRLRRIERAVDALAPVERSDPCVAFSDAPEAFYTLGTEEGDYSPAEWTPGLVIVGCRTYDDRHVQPTPEPLANITYSAPAEVSGAGMSEGEFQSLVARKAAIRPYNDIRFLIDGVAGGQQKAQSEDDKQKLSDAEFTHREYMHDLARFNDFSSPQSRMLWPTPISPARNRCGTRQLSFRRRS